MGNYNPDTPIIVGQQWVPIREETTLYTPNVTVAEIGHTFITNTAYTLQDGRMYIKDWPFNGLVTNGIFGAPSAYGIAVYPTGGEIETGPIRSVIIPVNNVGITGDGTIPTVTNMINALNNPTEGDLLSAGYVGGSVAYRLEIYFATNQYSQLLQGKRILGVDYLYSFSTVNDPAVFGGWTKSLAINAFRSSPPTSTFMMGIATGATNITFPVDLGTVVRNVYARRLGEVSIATQLTGSPVGWNYEELRRFENTHADRVSIAYSSTIDALNQTFWSLNYSALKVYFCEERRVASGVAVFNAPNLLVNNTNIIPMRNPQTNAANPNLPSGQYTVVSRAADLGFQAEQGLVGVPWGALRQLYPIQSFRGVQVNHPYPLDDQALGATFTTDATQVLPQISLHTSTGPLVEVHAYGRQAAAQVHGTNTAIQQIDDSSPAITGYTYPQVRFYARRFGHTVLPLTLSRQSNPLQKVSITPADFDALAPSGGIIDGWKEVNLRFPAASIPNFGPTGSQWVWSATGERSNNRWEILGAYAPALSGTPGNLLNQINPAAQRLGAATYGAPVSGSQVALSWMPQWGPPVSANSVDPAADAFLIFSQDPPTVTGFTLTTQSQAISGIGLDCGGGAPCCIPTGITFHEMTWGGSSSRETFSDDASGGTWGVSDNGLVWSGGTGAFVSGGIGWNANQAGSNAIQNVIQTRLNDSEIYYETMVPFAVTGGGYNANSMLRWGDSDSYYMGDVIFRSGNQLNVNITRRTASGGFVDLASERFACTYDAGVWISVKFQVNGTQLRIKAWQRGQPEPDWIVKAFDTSIIFGDSSGIRTEFDSTTGPSPATIAYDNICVYPPVLDNGGHWEIQRSDTLTDWKTVMLADPCVWKFRDYEARVGVNSFYRMRMVNGYNFVGAWSTPVTGFIPSPGVTGSACLNLSSDNRTLIFTSNYNQTGLYNLAYVPVWENGTPSEDFAFPESSTVSFGRMYNRNFQVGFKPTERGGEVFSRNILVNAAAVALPKLANIKSLRDMAWQNAPYICVRDNLGDRWFASVQVPNERVKRNGRLYIAQVDIVEVTDTPYPVNPA